VRVDHLRAKVGFSTLTIPAVPDASANFAQEFTYTEMRDLLGSFSAEFDLADNVLAYVKGGLRDGREDGIYGGMTVLDAATGDGRGNALVVLRTDNNEAIEAGVRGRFGSATTHEITLGGNAVWQVNRNAYDFRYGEGFAGFATNLYNPTQVPLPSSTLVGGDLDDPFPITRNRLASLFAADAIGLWNERVLLTVGARVQSIVARQYDANTAALSNEYEEDAVTPMVGVVLKPVEGLSLYASRMEGLQQGAQAPLDPSLTNPGEMLAPRKSVQYEIGGKFSLGPVFASLALYQIERPGEGILPGNTFGYLGDQRHRGIELTVNGDIAEGLRVISGLSVIEAELVGGNKVVGVPDLTANADFEWDLPFLPGLTLTGRVTHTGEQYANAANTLELDAWTTFDLGARYVLVAGDRPITLRVAIDNIADESYWASAFDAFNPALLQGQPRTVKASISTDF
jgi:iron complex outermembrane receptor protein